MSDSHFKGVVKYIDGPNNYGFYSMKIGDTKYGLGKSRPQFAVGDTVEFDYYLKDGKYATVKGPVSKAEGAPAPKPPQGSAGGSRDGYWADKDKYDREVKEPRIAFYAAYERAVLFTELAIKSGAFPALEKAKAADKLGLLESFIEDKTSELITASDPTANTRTKAASEPGAAKEPDGDDSDDSGQWE